MLEKYITMKYFFEFKLPLTIGAVLIALAVLGIFISWIIKSYEKRQHRMIEKYYNED